MCEDRQKEIDTHTHTHIPPPHTHIYAHAHTHTQERSEFEKKFEERQKEIDERMTGARTRIRDLRKCQVLQCVAVCCSVLQCVL